MRFDELIFNNLVKFDYCRMSRKRKYIVLDCVRVRKRKKFFNLTVIALYIELILSTHKFDIVDWN